MPLVNLTSDLTNLRYGGDRPGGGSSGQPYIISPRPDQLGTPPLILASEFRTSNFLYTNFYDLNTNTRDFPIRGGSIQQSDYGASTTPAGTIDRIRISEFLRDPQKGKLFLEKQVGLQLTNPKTQVPFAAGTVRISPNDPIDSIIETTRYYNPTGANTLEQVNVSGTGIHLQRHGAVLLYTNVFNRTYEDVVRFNNDQATNRLSLLAQFKLRTDAPIYIGAIGRAFDYGISTLNSQILNYEGGPGSTYGIGNTIIRRATDTNNARAYGAVAMSYDTLFNQKTTDGYSKAHPIVQDFRAQINTQAGSTVLMTASYNDPKAWYNKRGNPGANPLSRRIDYTMVSTEQDRLNRLQPYTYDPNEQTPWEAQSSTQDIIKFTFECISNNDTSQAMALVFRAFLTSFSDNNQGEYNSFKYLGRGETFRTYQGFDRSISFNFKIAAFTRQEMQPLYTKLNTLISQVYPDYSPKNRFMRASLIKLTIGDYLYRIPGFLENVNITVDNNASWEIALDAEGKDADMRQLPQVVDVQCSFKPIHDFLPRRVTIQDPYVPIIASTPRRFLSGVIESGDRTLEYYQNPALLQQPPIPNDNIGDSQLA